jgi:dihydroorotate dehydrogenase
LAAGFDKDAAVQGVVKFGFGFIEIGTLTKGQEGNPKSDCFD